MALDYLPCIRCSVNREDSSSMNCAMTQNIARKLSAREEYKIIMNRGRGMKAAIYGEDIREEMLKAG